MRGPTHFKTERLVLRPFRPEDLEPLQRYAVREEFWRYLPLEPQTPETVASFLQARLDEVWGDGGYSCAVELKGASRLIGTARVSMADSAPSAGDLGYALDDQHRGRGYMTEAVRRMLSIGFSELNLHRIWATADVDNTASWRLMERVGMRREGRLRGHKCVRGAWRDSYLYASLATDPVP